MEKEYWINKWRSNDIAFHDQNVNPDLITYIHALNLLPGDCIFIPLCGKTKDMIWLANEGFHVIGVELSEIACNEFFTEMNITPQITQKSKFIHYKHNNIELLCGDLFDLIKSDLPIIQAVYDCKALIALPSNLRKKYVNHLVSCLGTKIKILLLTSETNCKINPPPYSVDDEEIILLYGTCFNVKQLKSVYIQDIPERLIKKGYLKMKESVYLISQYQISYDPAPKFDDTKIIWEGISKHAKRERGLPPGKPFAFFIRDELDHIKGGCSGYIYYGCLYVDLLWVDESLRGKQYGSQLMKNAEQLAKENHCNFIAVNTMDFEALEFYKKLDFKVEFERKGFEKNSSMYFLRKDLI